MLGLIEIALFLVPLAVYAIWRCTAAQGGPSATALGAGAVAVAMLAGTLLWYTQDSRMAPGTTYVPPQLQDGRLIPGHVRPR